MCSAMRFWLRVSHAVAVRHWLGLGHFKGFLIYMSDAWAGKTQLGGWELQQSI